MLKLSEFIDFSLSKKLFSIAIPIIFANILQTAYQLIDTFWVGRLGTDAVASISVSFPIIFFMISLGGGISIAGTALVSQFKGKQNSKAINHIALQTMLVVFIISIFISIVGYFSSPYLLSFMDITPEVFDQASKYLQITFIGTTFSFVYMVFQSLMRGVGQPKFPMYIVGGTVLLNLLLDPLFIYGYGPIPGSGVGGAAIATIFTQGISAIIGTLVLLRGNHQIKLSFEKKLFDFEVIQKIVKIGLPASVEQSTTALGIALMTGMVSSFGTTILAAYGIGTRVLSFIIIPAIGLSIATTTLVGQAIGSGNLKQAEYLSKLSTIISFVSLSVVGVFVFLLSTSIATIFMPGEIQTIALSSNFIKILSISFGFMGAMFVLRGVFRGAGQTGVSMILALIALWGLRVPVGYFLSKYTSLSHVGIWISFPLSFIVTSILSLVRFRVGKWKEKDITNDIKLSVDTIDETIIEEGTA